MKNRRKILVDTAGSASFLIAPSIFAQSPSNKPLRIVVGFPPGGVADIFARTIAPSLQESLGTNVIVENRAGANGNIAAEAVSKAAPDGNILVLSSTGIETVNPLILPKGSFDVTKDLQPVALLGDIQLFLVTKQGLEPNNFKEFLAYAKRNVGKLSYGSAGSGSTPHIAGELFKQNAGVFATHIPYRGAAPALQDLLAGQLDFYFDPGISFPHVRSDKLKMLAVASARRSELFPNVPTLAESGIRGVEADTLFGLWAPAGVPAELIARIHREVNQSLARSEVKERFKTVGGNATPVSIAEFKSRIAAEAALFGGIIRARKIAAD